MSNLISYLKQEGITATIKRAWKKIFLNGDNHTVFLRVILEDISPINGTERDINVLDETNRTAFDKIKFWNFINADKYIGNDHQSVVMLREDGKFVGYAAEEHEIQRIIHGLGEFSLKKNEGWIGPVFVCREWRGRGLNKQLLLQQMYRLNNIGVTTIYTAINSDNYSSLNSFRNVGFNIIGAVNGNGEIIYDLEDILHTAFKKKERV